MKARIVRIEGLRIPKGLILQTGLTGEVEISVEENRLVRPAARPRSGWAGAFRSMAKHGDDRRPFAPDPLGEGRVGVVVGRFGGSAAVGEKAGPPRRRRVLEVLGEMFAR